MFRRSALLARGVATGRRRRPAERAADELMESQAAVAAGVEISCAASRRRATAAQARSRRSVQVVRRSALCSRQ